QSGRYGLKEEGGRGGQARIHIASDEHIGRRVAFKELLPGLDTGQEERMTHAMVRFLREARITGQLEHPNIVPVYEIGRRQDGRLYYTMRLVKGRTLAAVLSEC